MANIIGDAAVRILPETRYFARDVGKQLSSPLKSVFGKLGAIAGGAFIGVKALRFFGDAFAEAREANKVLRQTQAVLKSTGKVAGVSAEQVDELATTLSAVAGVDDELIVAGENLLLTFTNIRNEVGAGNDIFNQATAAALDMSAALGQDMQSSVIQLGKALNDPIRGITALRRVGVAFTEQQQAQIKTLVKSGKTLEAQKLILAELSVEFGGAAAAAADPWDRFKVAVGNLKETIGLALMPTLEGLAKFFTNTLIPVLEGTVIPAVKNLFRGLGDIVEIAQEAGIRAIGGFFEAFNTPEAAEAERRVNDMREDAIEWRDIMGSLSFVLNNSFRDIGFGAGTLARFMEDKVGPVFGDVAFEITQAWGTVSQTYTDLGGTLTDFFLRFREVFNGIGQIATGLFDVLVAVGWSIRGFFSGLLSFVAGVVTGNWKAAWNGLANIAKSVSGLIGGVLGGLAKVVGGELKVIGGLLGEIGKAITGAFAGVGRAIGGAVSALFGAGQDLVMGLINGIWSMAGRLVRSMKEFVKRHIPGPIKRALGIESPSKVFAGFGRDIVRGLIVGIDSAAPGLDAAMRRLSPSLDIPDVRLTGTVVGGDGGFAGVQPLVQNFNVAVQGRDPEVIARAMAYEAARAARR